MQDIHLPCGVSQVDIERRFGSAELPAKWENVAGARHELLDHIKMFRETVQKVRMDDDLMTDILDQINEMEGTAQEAIASVEAEMQAEEEDAAASHADWLRDMRECA